MKKIISKTNICLLIVALCAMLFCGLFAISNLTLNRPSATAYEAGSSATLIGENTSVVGWYDWSYYLNYDITTLTITNNYNVPENPVQSWDASEAKDGSLMAYVTQNAQGKYDCVIYGNVETIYAPANCQNLFAGSGATTGSERIYTHLATLETINFENFDTSKATNMISMFRASKSLKSLDLSDWDISNVKNMGHMFDECFELETLNLTGWDTSSVTDMSFMFISCISLKNIIGMDFNTSNVTEMAAMFTSCFALENVNVSNFDTSKSTSFTLMFSGCSSLQVLDLSNFDLSSSEIELLMLGVNDASVLAMLSANGAEALISLYEQAIENNSVEERIEVAKNFDTLLWAAFDSKEEKELIFEGLFKSSIKTIYAPKNLNSKTISLPFNDSVPYVYKNGGVETTTDYLVEKGNAEELAIYLQNTTPLAKPEASAPSVTPETGFVDEQLLPAMAVGIASMLAVVFVANKKKKFNI